MTPSGDAENAVDDLGVAHHETLESATVKTMKLNPLIVSLTLAVATLAGCSSDQVAGLQSARAATTQAIADTNAAAADAQARADALAANDPTRKQLQATADALAKTAATLEAKVPLLDAAIASAKSGAIDPSLIGQVSLIPGLPPQANLFLALAGIAGTAYQTYKKRQADAKSAVVTTAFTQVVKSVDAVLPEPTKDQRAVMDKIQDESTTQALVAKAKAGNLAKG